jgi:hypothetical protein
MLTIAVSNSGRTTFTAGHDFNSDFATLSGFGLLPGPNRINSILEQFSDEDLRAAV